jgi:hypothetical protein
MQRKTINKEILAVNIRFYIQPFKDLGSEGEVIENS